MRDVGKHGGAPSSGTLLERDGEMSAIADACRSARDGDGRLVVVAGRAGIGKSGILADGQRSARTAGFTVLTARGSELEREFAFGVVRQLFERAVQRAPHWWAGAAEHARAVLDGVPVAPGGIFNDVSQSVLHGLYWLVVNASSDGPLLLSIDDLQLCDRSSLRFLSYLCRRLDGLPVVVLAGLRTSGRHTADPTLTEVLEDPATEILEPQPLTAEAVTELLRRRLSAAPSTELAADCHRATGGNPLLIDELARALQADGVRPDIASVDVVATLGARAVSRTVLSRLAHAGAPAISVAQALSVVGDWAGVAMLESVTGLDADAIEKATRALLQAEIVLPGTPLRFVHPLVRDAIYREMTPVEAERRHLRATEALRRDGRPAEQIAAHALALRPAGRQWVVECLREAALIAVGRGAADDALSYLRRAVDEPAADEVRPRLLQELGMAESLANEPISAVEHLRAAYASTDDPAESARIAGVLARMLIFTNPPADAVTVLREARQVLPPGLGDLDDALAAIELYAVSFGAADADRGHRAAEIRPPDPGSGPGARMLAAGAAWDRALTGGTAVECVELALAALADGVLIRADPWFMSIVAAGVLVLADEPSALDVWQQMLADGHRNGSALTINGVRLWQGWNLLEWGALDDADLALGLYSADTIRRKGERENGMAYFSGFHVRLLVERGDLAGAREALDRAGRVAPGSDGDLLLRRAETEVLLGETQWQRAFDAATRLQDSGQRVVNPAWMPSAALRSRALVGLGRYDEALEVAGDGLTAARHWGAGSTVGSALRVLAAALDAAGAASCIDTFEEAVAVLDSSPARLEAARAEFGLGAALRRRGQVTAARVHLAGAGEKATRCGANGLAELAASELQVAGGRPRRRAVSGTDSLTPSERRVVELAAAGRTNRAIAQELFVTPKTIEVHLSSAYRKLGITSRSGLVGVWPPDPPS